MDYHVGITGNYYFYSLLKIDLINVCKLINKSPSSIYRNSKYGIYAIRIKNRKTKLLVKSIFTRYDKMNSLNRK